jgi:hypothetical protein
MAGQALDPNAAGGSDLALAELLLTHTLASLAAVFDGDDADRSASDAIDVLERSGVLTRAAGSAEAGRSVLSCLTNGGRVSPERDDLAVTELLLGKALRIVRGEPAISRATRWSRWALALLFAAGVAGAMAPTLAPLFHRRPWAQYKWTASSAASSYSFATSGLLGAHGVHELVFHTEYEDRPRVTIDLLETRTIHALEIKNRTDCCAERAIPLVVEVAESDGHFVEVARQNENFAVWKVEFARRPARYVRLWVDARTYLHLQEIQFR